MKKTMPQKIIVGRTEYNKYQAMGFLALLLFSGFLVIYTMWNFITPILFGAILAGAFYPFLDFLINKKKLSRVTASALVSLIIVVVIFVPLVYFVIRLSKEILDIYETVQTSYGRESLTVILFGDNWFADTMKRIFQFLDLDYTPLELEKQIVGGLKKISLFALNSINLLIGNIFSFLFQIVIMIFVIYGLFSEGPSLKNFLLNLSPLKNEDEEIILKKFNTMNYATLFYNGIGGLLQGGLAGLGFWIAGIHSVILWTSIMIVLAFIPLLGISIIYIPATIYLFLAGSHSAAITLFVYCSLVAFLTENWFKPLFMGKHAEISSILMFFSILGGMSAFGMAGIFYGPLIISVFLTIAQIYVTKYVIMFDK